MDDENIEQSEEVSVAPFSNKLDISKYADAVDKDGNPAFKVGDQLIIERYSNFGTKTWLDTRQYVVVSIDLDNGEVKLFDNKFKQSAYTNFKRAHTHGDILKILSKKN